MHNFRSKQHQQRQSTSNSSSKDFDLIENYLEKPLCVPNDSLEDLPSVFDFGENLISLKDDKLLDRLPPVPLPNFDFDFDSDFRFDMVDSSVPVFIPRSSPTNKNGPVCVLPHLGKCGCIKFHSSCECVDASTDTNKSIVVPVEISSDKQVKMYTTLPMSSLCPVETKTESSEVKMCTTLPMSSIFQIETKSHEFELPSSDPLETRSPDEVKTCTVLPAYVNPAKTRSLEANMCTIQPKSMNPLKTRTDDQIKTWTTLPIAYTKDNTSKKVSSKFSSSEKEYEDISTIDFPMDELQAHISPNFETALDKTRRKRTRETRARDSLEDLVFGRDVEESTSTISDGKPKPKRRCTHCQTEKTPQWRKGPLGKGTLCNACGVRHKLGRLLPEYRPAGSPSFDAVKHSNFHRQVLKMRTHDKKSRFSKKRSVIV